MSGASPLVFQGDRSLLGSVTGTGRALRRTRACVGALCTELLSSPSPHLSERERFHLDARAAQRLALRMLEIVGVQLTVRGSIPSGPVVLVSNHLGWLDPVVLGALLPLAAIAKSELSRWPFLGRVAAHVGTLFLHRGSPHHGAVVLRASLRRLVSGVPVLNFPEGTTTDGSGALLPFRRGIFGIARRSGVPVVPVALRVFPEDTAWVGGAPFLPHYWRTTSRSSVRAVVRFGEPRDARSAPSAQACAAVVRARVAALLRGHSG